MKSLSLSLAQLLDLGQRDILATKPEPRIYESPLHEKNGVGRPHLACLAVSEGH